MERVYHRQLLKELEEILEAIPSSSLAIQFDCACEFQHLENVGMTPSWFGDTYSEKLAAVRIVSILRIFKDLTPYCHLLAY